jgi:hypothetical protein
MNGRMEGEFEGGRYRIWFQRRDVDDIGLPTPTETMALIERYEEGDPGAWWGHSTGFAYLSAKDQHVKEIGRKHALTDALLHEPREFRAFIWSLYHGRKAGAK